LFHARC